MALRLGLTNLERVGSRPVFFDANVILRIHWPVGRVPHANYSGVLKQLYQRRQPLATDVTVLSEVVNRVLHFEHQKEVDRSGVPAGYNGFKIYRDSPEGKTLHHELAQRLQKALGNFQFLSKGLSTAEALALLGASGLDFNDQIIVEVCRHHDCVLLTHDGDYVQAPVDTLSLNPALLAPQP